VDIYNIYNLVQKYRKNAADILLLLENIVITGAEQVVLGDFNLYYFK
jgi:hypothetical protein